MPATRDALIIAILFLIPGFISDGVLSKQFARQKRDATELVLSVILLSLVNYACLSPLLLWLYRDARPLGYTRYAQTYPGFMLWITLGVLFLAPLVEAILIGRTARSRFGVWLLATLLDVRVKDPAHPPTAWDFVFERNRYYLVLVTLTDGSKVGGGFGGRSYATEHPNEQELYLEVAYEVDTDGRFGAPLPLSVGILLKRSDIRALEFYEVQEQGDGDQEYE